MSDWPCLGSIMIERGYEVVREVQKLKPSVLPDDANIRGLGKEEQERTI